MNFTKTTRAALAALAILSTAGVTAVAAQSAVQPATPLPAYATRGMSAATQQAPATAYFELASIDANALPASSTSSAALPEAPSALLQQQSTDSTQFQKTGQTSAKPSMVVPTDFAVPPLSAAEKVKLTFIDTFSLESLVGITLSAGYAHVTNGQPNYGTNAVAFGKRFGAAAARDSSQEIFSDAIFAPIFHQDPRYYREGSSHNFAQRVVYAATRTLITRTDGGHDTINASLLLGTAGGTALTRAYYPAINRNFHDYATSYGGSLGGQALYYLYSEFFNSAKDLLHFRTAQ